MAFERRYTVGFLCGMMWPIVDPWTGTNVKVSSRCGKVSAIVVKQQILDKDPVYLTTVTLGE